MSKKYDDEEDDTQEPKGGPDPDKELVDDEGKKMSAAKAAEKLSIFGAALASRRDEWVAARSAQGHDRRFTEDLEQYNGRDAANRASSEMMASVEQGFPVTQKAARPTRSTVFVQVTRQKTNALAARWQDIVVPSDDRNFALASTPVPGMPQFVHVPPLTPQGAPEATPQQAAPQPPSGVGVPDGAPPIGGPQPAAAAAAQTQGLNPGSQQPTQGSPATGPEVQTSGNPASPHTVAEVTPEEQGMLDQQAEAKKRASAMQVEIDDDFEECDISGEYRKALFDCSLYGTGVLKGPVVVHRTRKAWNKKFDAKGDSTWSLEIVKEIKPASFRVDPRRIYPDPMCGENVQNGRGLFEYDRKTSKQVRALGSQPGYIKTQLLQAIEEGGKAPAAAVSVSEREDQDYGKGDLFNHWIYWGEVEREDLEAAGVEISDDELEVTSACIEMINDIVVRAYLNPLPDGALPYDMCPCERNPGSVWGFGVPFLMRSQQRVINAAWRMILDNAGVSSGPQIVIKPGMIRPADNNQTITARKLWYATDDVEDVRKAFTTFEFASHQPELAAIIDMADRLSDQETAVPMLSQGQQGSAPETVGGMQILMQGANVMLRRLVKQFDDYIIKPHVRRYYDFHMEYSDKEFIKGDFQVVALGSSTLVVKDIQNQAYQNLLAMGTNPAYSPLINLKKLFEKAIESSHIAPRDIMNTDAEIQAALQRAAAQAQPDPRIVAAQKKAESDAMRTQAMVQMNRDTLSSKSQLSQEQIAAQERIAGLSHEANLQKADTIRQNALDASRTQLATTGIKERVKQDMQANELQVNGATQGSH